VSLSGVYDYSVLASDIITAAFEDIQVAQPGETITNNDQTTALRTLNLLTKEWMGKPGFAPGLKRWSRNFLYLFLRKNKNVYVLGQTAQTTDKAALNGYSSGLSSGTSASGQAVLTMEAVANWKTWPTGVAGGSISNTDIIGVQLSTGDFQWTTVSSGGGTTSLTLTANLTASVSSGAQVFAYPTTSFVDLPLDFLTCVRRDINGIDYQMEKMLDIQDYETISNKNITTTPVMWFYEKKRVTGNLYLNGFASTLTDVIRACVLYPLDDESAVGNDLAFPQQWYTALEWGLAFKLCPKYGKVWSDTMQKNLDEAMTSASAVDPEIISKYFEPGREFGTLNYSTP
jgi:hypothetical protein